MAASPDDLIAATGLDRTQLSAKIQAYITEQEKVCQPDSVHVCDGSEAENAALLGKLEKVGRIHKLPKYENWLVGVF